MVSQDSELLKNGGLKVDEVNIKGIDGCEYYFWKRRDGLVEVSDYVVFDEIYVYSDYCLCIREDKRFGYLMGPGSFWMCKND